MVDKEIKQQGVYKQWDKPIELNTKFQKLVREMDWLDEDEK